MFYMQERLVESIQRDRHREAEAARRNTLPGTKESRLRRLVDAPWTVITSMRRTRPAVPHTSA
jgi:hypothetical protein